jgi:phage gpG-like protein
MIKAEIIGGEALQNHVGNLYPKLIEAVRGSITRSLLDLVRYVKSEKLSGQVLRNRTGRLRRSINASQVIETAGGLEGTVGTNVEYGKTHEYGYQGPVTVKAHMRTIKQAWGHALKSPVSVSVRSHSRQVNLPERSFLRSALADLAPQISANIKADIERAWK